MTELRVVPARDAPLDSLIRLWERAFGDSAEFVTEFLKLLPEIGIGYAAAFGEKTVGMAYCITGLTLKGAGDEIRCGYIYAVATDENFRRQGIAETLCRRCAEEARRSGCEIMLVSPANDRLFDYYGRIIGTDRVLKRQARIYVPENNNTQMPKIKALSAKEYNALREKLLAGTPHIALSDRALYLEELICREYGGELCAVGQWPAAYYPERERVLIKELLCPDEFKAAAARAISARAKTRDALLYSASTLDGEKYLEADSGLYPEKLLCSILFD